MKIIVFLEIFPIHESSNKLFSFSKNFDFNKLKIKNELIMCNIDYIFLIFRYEEFIKIIKQQFFIKKKTRLWNLNDESSFQNLKNNNSQKIKFKSFDNKWIFKYLSESRSPLSSGSSPSSPSSASDP